MKFKTNYVIVGFCLLSSLFLSVISDNTDSYPTVIHNSTDYVTSKSQVFPVGVSASFGGYSTTVFKLVSMIADIFNNQTDILPDVRLELYMTDLMYSDANTLASTQSLVKNNKIRAIVSSVSVSETKVAQLVSRISGIPQVTPLTINYALSNKNDYPNLARVVPNEVVQAKAIAEFLVMNKWTQVLVLYNDDESGVTGLEQLKSITQNINITVHSIQMHTGDNVTDYIGSILHMVSQYRLRIFVHYTTSTMGLPLIPELIKAGLMGSAKYAHILAYNMAIFVNSFVSRSQWAAGTVGLIPRAGNGPVYEDFLARWAKNNIYPWYLGDPQLAWYFPEALMSIIYSLDRVMKQTGLNVDKITGAMHMGAFKYLTYVGVTGNVSLDDKYDRRGDFDFINFGTNYSQSFLKSIGFYSTLNRNITLYNTIRWSEGATVIADGVCVCYFGTCDENDVCHCNPGFTGLTCSDHTKSAGFDTTLIIIAVVVPVVLLIAMAVAATRYASYKKASAIKDVADRQKSSIKRSDITFNQAIGRGASGVVFRAMFRGTEVAVKRIMTEDVSKSVIQEFELESAVMAGLRHPNIVLFMGSCLVPEDKEMLLVMEFMEKGSLHDVLHNPKVNFTFELGLHIASQAAKGMNFLHQASPPIIHRDLKSHNILLDDKWNARIADFGITKMKDLTTSGKSKAQEEHTLGTILWTAPEVFEGNSNTEKSDCYSFGIVLWELAHRQNPYEGREPMAVALDVARSALRPIVTATMIPEYEELMRDCWAQDPERRPSFQEITQRLRQMTMKYPVSNFHSNNSKVIEPPAGMVYFVQTEVVGGNSLWDKHPSDMLAATETHNRVLRTNMDNCDGYEVSFDDDGFLVAFEDLANALDFCIASQVTLLHVEWPNKIASDPIASKVVSAGGEVIWNGLRVRMSLHSGVPNSSVDVTTGRTKYFGPVVDRVRKLLISSPASVSIVTSAAIIEIINSKNLKLTEAIVHSSCGQVSDTARTKTESIYGILPKSLEARSSRPKSINKPYTVVDIDDEVAEIEPSPRKQDELSWLVKFEQFSIKESVGKGSIGDYYHATWKGREIAIKALINQKLDEADMLHLKARVSALSKIKHKNLVEVYGVCFEPGHISLLTEFIPKAGLRQLLSNESIPLSWPTKLKIAKQVAEGMAYLSTFEDPGINIHTNLKSGNVLVNLDSGEVKVTDFGQGSLKDLARTMTSVGTVAWTAPEVLNGEEVTASISVYAFGIIMHEILTRKMPYPSEHPIKLVAKVLAGHRPAVPTDCPADYKELMEQCWSSDPSMRPTWSSIAHRLSTILTTTK